VLKNSLSRKTASNLRIENVYRSRESRLQGNLTQRVFRESPRKEFFNSHFRLHSQPTCLLTPTTSSVFRTRASRRIRPMQEKAAQTSGGSAC
jgi:hypothetical protein